MRRRSRGPPAHGVGAVTHPWLQPLADRIAAVESRLDKLTAALAELHTARLPEPRGVAALEETERRIQEDLAWSQDVYPTTRTTTAPGGPDDWARSADAHVMAQEFNPPEADHARDPSRAVRPANASLVASPEVGEGDAPQGSRIVGHQPPMVQPDEMCPNCCTPWKCNGPHLEISNAVTCDWCDERVVTASDGTMDICERCARACVQMLSPGPPCLSSTYCAICDGGALPPAVRLKGGGFVCEGCVVD